MIALFAWATASAQQSCIEPVSTMQIGAELGEVRKSLELRDVVDARRRLDRVTERLPCLDDVIPTAAWADYARYVSIAFFFRQEEDEMVRWARAAAWADPASSWGAAYPEDHPLRRIVAEAGPPTVTAPDGMQLAPPRGGGIYLSGNPAARPEAPVDVPVFVQVFDKDHQRVSAWYQNGPLFPERWLVPGTEAAPPAAWWGQPAPAPKPERSRDRGGGGGGGAPVASLVTGGLLLAASGVTYALAGQAASSMDELRTSPELTSARTRANALVLVSGVALVGGVGVVGGGVVLSGGTIGFRF